MAVSHQNKHSSETGDVVCDELLCFLASPLFQVPVLTFMESSCIIFEPCTDDSEAYRNVHTDYKKLVEALLDSFLKDIDLSHEQMVKAMQVMSQKMELQNYQVIFEEILSLDDFCIFVRLMTQKNIEIQQQALMLIISATGRLDLLGPDSHQGAKNKEEEELLSVVLEQSKREYEEQQRMSQQEEDDLNAILQLSRVEAEKLEAEHQREERKLQEALQSLNIDSSKGKVKRSSNEQKTSTSKLAAAEIHKPRSPTPAVMATGRLTNDHDISDKIQTSVSKQSTGEAQPSGKALDKGGKSKAPVTRQLSSSEAAANWLKSAQEESDGHSQAVHKAAAAIGALPPDELRKRQEYLRQQRDKLVAMKRKEREKQLDAERSTSSHSVSGQVAHNAMNSGPDQTGDGSNDKDAEYERKIAMRRAIAEKIKAELMSNQ